MKPLLAVLIMLLVGGPAEAEPRQTCLFGRPVIGSDGQRAALLANTMGEAVNATLWYAPARRTIW